MKKASFEAASYGREMAAKMGSELHLAVLGPASDLDSLGNYAQAKLLHVNDASLAEFEPFTHGETLNQIASEVNAKAIVIAGTTNGKMLSGMLGVFANAAVITNAIEVPESYSPLTVKRKAFSNKAFAWATSESETTVVSFIPNSIGVSESGGSVELNDRSDLASSNGKTNIENTDMASGKIPLPEAELVVSAGRGLKGPENWGMVEEMAELLGAGIACSKPVSDMGWRPHTEHVGQTGIAINPQLYLAIGISGAIQHLAGVSASKNIVVINKDPEAPFFKSADYGIVGDAFEVVPKLNAVLKSFKEGNV